MSRGKIVIIEGTSCVGKTTICNLLQNQGWVVIPEAIRYIEKETNKKGDDASPVPLTQEEEEFYQDQLFRVELQKIIEANELSKKGIDVVIDKSAIATVATAKAFEKDKGFDGTFKRACNLYLSMLDYLDKNNLIECDLFLLLTADYETIIKRNITRNHILSGIWIEEDIINNQRTVLETMTDTYIGKSSKNEVVVEKLDTTKLNKDDVLDRFNEIISNLDNENKKERRKKR